MSYHCMTKMKNRLLVLILIPLLNKMHSLDAYTKACNSSVQTVKRVETCPSSVSSYKKAAKEKNCSSLAGKARECQSFEYHCVLSDDRKYAIEVCAPSINIVGYVCAKFSTNLTGIIRIDDFDCTKCPYSYNSTTAFEYSECYANITLPFTTDSSQNSTVTTTSKENDAVIFDGVSTSKPNDEDIFDSVSTSKPNDGDMNMDPENKQHGVIAALGSIIGIMSICIVIILIWRKIRKRASKCTEVPEIFRLISNGSQRRPLSQNQHSSTKNDQNEESNLPLISKTVTENGLISNGSQATTNRRPLSQNQHSSTKNDQTEESILQLISETVTENGYLENKLYNNHDSGVKFAMLTTTLADKFPHQKLQSLKLMLQASGKVANVKRLKETELVSECFSLLLDENLYSQSDVVFMQFLCKQMGCMELYRECITYAFEHKALCFYEKNPDDGQTYLKFHVNADLKYYTKEKIQDIVQVVADILRCKKEEIEIHSLEHSQSFILTLSIKKNYKWKMSDLSANERQKLVSLDVDFLIVGKETLVLDRSKDNCENKIYNDQDSGIEFAKLTNYLVGSIAADDFQHLKDAILTSEKVANVASLKAANSVLDCFHVLLDENLFTQNDVTFMQFLCKQIHSDELYRKCTKYALAHESSCSSGNTLKSKQEDTSRCSKELMTKNKETTSDKEEWPPEVNKGHFLKWMEDDKVFVETHNFPAMFEKVKSQPFVTFVGVQGSGKTATVRHIALKLRTEEYEILQIQNIEDIETYLKPHPQVFVIDDVLGIFELNTSKLVQLNRYIQYEQRRLKKLNSKILLTCREKVFRNEDVLMTDLCKKENVVQMHSPENTLTDEDKQKILAVYALKNTDFTSILAFVRKTGPTPTWAFETKTDFTTVFETKTFPKRCEVVSKRKKAIYSNCFQDLYEYPIPLIEMIVDELDEMKARNRIYYASLVLLVANGKELSTDCLKNENNDSCVKNLNDMKSTILKAFGIIDSIENHELITALKEMELMYTMKVDNKFTFLNHFMFEIIACHFGCMFPKLMFQYMDSSYIDTYIKLNTPVFWDYKEIPVKGCEATIRFPKNEMFQFKIDGYFSIMLPEIKYPLLAERLFRDVENEEAIRVFSNDFLKHPLVIQAFIDIMARKSYRHLYSVFFSELKGNVNHHFLLLIFAKSGISFKEHFKRIIHFVIYKCHHHILQHIIERMIKENGNVDDLFSASCKRNTRYLDIETRDDELEFESVVGYEDHEKSNEGAESERKHRMEDSNKTRESHLEPLKEQYCLLALACHTRDINIVQILLSHINSNVFKLFNQLLKPGDFDILTPYFTPLGFACSIRNLEIVVELIKAGADVNTIDQEKTPLIDACDRGHLQIVSVLVKSGADVNLKVISNTPLTAACNRGHLEIVKELIQAGADVNLQNGENAPLKVACNRGHLEIVKELIQAGADVNLQHGENAPLKVAYVKNNFKIVQELIKAGTVPDPADIETTPLLAANVMHNLRFLEELIDTKAGQYLNNIEICLKEGNVKENPFLLRAACMKGHLDTVEKLIDAGADVNQSDGSQKPLTAACMWGHLSVVKVMIKAGASVNQSIGKETPLTAACAAGHLNVVQELIREGADLNRCDDNHTPLTVASFEGHQSIVRTLIKAGADVNQKDKDTTPLEAALRNRRLSIVEELKKAGAV